MSLRRLAPLCAAAAAVAFPAACDPAPEEAAAARVTYTCCSAKDVETLYRPGQTLSLHWTAEPPNGPATGSPQAELTARLTGPYATVDELKAAADPQTAAGAVTFTAAPIRPTGEHPVSTILIGSDARPGYYNLTTTFTDQQGGSAGGASIVRVVAKG